MPSLTTHNGLTLRWENERVTLEGEVKKILYPIGTEVYNIGEASSVYNAVKAHYEARAAALVAAGTPEEKAEREGAVELENLTRKRQIARGPR